MNQENPSCGRRGAALVIILAVLVLVAVIAIGFLARAATERRASSADRAAAQTLSLAEMAVHVVQAQINQATRRSGTAWTSQPGVVRVFDTNGVMVAAHKLYSAADMTSNDGVALRSEDLPPPGWHSQPALWTDLNAWVEFDGDRRYPILDPRVADNDAEVEGLSLASSTPVTARQPAPMPVRWLYVLENGRLVAAEGSDDVVVVPGSEDSPIVGRVAFWTDDETCKVNINTAGDGTFWDVPRAYSPQEGELADRQPARNEFQRYPGHPATTSLRAVFPNATGQQLLSSLTPRYRWGGSMGGATPTTSANPIIDLREVSDRLYSSVDELVFNSSRGPGLFGRDAVERRRFLLTAHSRAPELNLFNLPRIAIWPVHEQDTAAFRTVLDREIARASTINGMPYYFQRRNAASPSADFAIARNLQLYAYLENLTGRAIPGFGTRSFEAKYPNGERQQILTQILDFIRSANLYDSLLGTTPGGQPFTPGRSGDIAQPGHGQAAPIRHPGNGTMGFGRFFTISELGLHFICTGDADEPGSNDPATNLTLREGAPLLPAVFDASGSLETPRERRVQAMLLFELFSPAAGWTLIRPNMEIRVSGLENILVNGEAVFPMDANGASRFTALQRELSNNRGWGATPGVRYPLLYKYAPARGRIAADPVPADGTAPNAYLYPFISNFFTVAGDTMLIEVQGPLTVEVLDLASGSPELIQTISLPAMAVRETMVPSLHPDANWWTFSRNSALVDGPAGRLDGVSSNVTNSTTPGHANARPTTRIFATTGPNNALNAEFDVVVSFIPEHGDYRLLAASHAVGVEESPFIPHPSWNAGNRFATTFYERLPGTLMPQSFYTGGVYAAGLDYNPTFTPDMNPEYGPIATGDWDTGISALMDGPYINKPDEGTIRRVGASGINSFPYFADQVSTSSVESFFSPTRQMPSAGVFGSLPTGVARGIPWQTLLFRPQPGHPGWEAPRDHLIMDLFWMPVAEPYAISEPFSTAGKINMNYEILPFTYINRATGMHAVLQGEKVTAIPNNRAMFYRLTSNSVNFRLEIDIAETLSQFTRRFSEGDVFRSATEICDLWIVPQNQTVAGMPAFWENHRLTGDNHRERIYTTLYPRLTTKSNTYTVHMQAQTLSMPPGLPPGQWDEARGRVTGEYRGSATIERHVDPNERHGDPGEPPIPDYAANPSAPPPLEEFYRWRTLSQTRFAP